MDRKEAVLIIVKNELDVLAKEKREELILEWWGIDESDEDFLLLPRMLQAELLEFDEPIDDVMHSKYNPLIMEGLKHKYFGVTNHYLSKKVSELTDEIIEVKGKVEVLQACPCCGYRTIKERGEYEVCPVCYWEDDGINDLMKYSLPNHMSIQEYKSTNMKIDSDMSKRYVDLLHQDE